MTNWRNSTSRACTSCSRPAGLHSRRCSTKPSWAAQLFLTSGKIASLEGQTVSHKDFDAEPDKAVWHSSVDVLISPSTSGAAEVLAGAIKGNKRGELVGERTFGSASEQKIIPLDDGGALILTVAFYSTPDGKSIVEEGVAPTVEVHPKAVDPSAPTDMEDRRRSVPASCQRIGRPGLQQGSRTAQGRRAKKGRLNV